MRSSPVLQKMRRMFDFIREFKFGRPQQFAALLLLAFMGLSLRSALEPHPSSTKVHSELRAGPPPAITSGIIITGLGSLLLQCMGSPEGADSANKVRLLILFLNTTMVAFG